MSEDGEFILEAVPDASKRPPILDDVGCKRKQCLEQ